MADRPKEPPSSEITPEKLYLRRRELIQNAALFTATALGVGGGVLALAGSGTRGGGDEKTAGAPPSGSAYPRNASYVAEEPPNSYEEVTKYNNYYEFGIN